MSRLRPRVRPWSDHVQSHVPNALLDLFRVLFHPVLPPSLKAATSRVVLSQNFKTLTKFIEKNTKLYSTKLIPLDLSLNIFS